MAEQTTVTQVRLQLHIPACYRQEPIISQLIAQYGLVVNITGAVLGDNTAGQGCFDLELRGTPQQISRGLENLRSLNVRLIGKPNPGGDCWHY